MTAGAILPAHAGHSLVDDLVRTRFSRDQSTRGTRHTGQPYHQENLTICFSFEVSGVGYALRPVHLVRRLAGHHAESFS